MGANMHATANRVKKIAVVIGSSESVSWVFDPRYRPHRSQREPGSATNQLRLTRDIGLAAVLPADR